MKSLARWLLIGLAVVFVAIQAWPYGRNHVNPPVTTEPHWNSPETRQLVVRACYDCHSNETVWPWYSNIAPFSWLAQSDVDRGRRQVNFSEWDRPQEDAEDSAETVRDGTMPPWYYTAVQSKARLSPAECDALIRDLEATFRGEKREEARGENEKDGNQLRR